MKHKNGDTKRLHFGSSRQTMTLFFTLLGWLLGFSSVAFPCSAVARRGVDKDFHLAANYDWRAKGGIVYFSPRDQVKEAAIYMGQQASTSYSWITRYASLTLSQFGRDYPMQGINEQGLAGVVLMAPAAYPSVGKQGVMTENLWLQHQLDRFASVGEVADHLEDFGIKKISADLHWFFCDASGECATVEFLEGRPQIHRSRDERMHVVTNSPVSDSWSWYRQWRHAGRPLPEGYNSFARFTRLAWRWSFEGAIDLDLSLNDVALDGFTAWQSIFNLQKRSILVRLAGQGWRRLSFPDLRLGCSEDLPMLNLHKNEWQSYSASEVKELLKHATDGLADEEMHAISEAVQKSERVICK